MDLRLLTDLLHGVRRELFNHRLLAAVLFMVMTSAVLLVGHVTPKTYTSTAVLHADVSNVLQPLLRGATEVTRVERANEAREALQSRSLLERVAQRSGLFAEVTSEEGRNQVISGLRNSIQIRVSSGNYLNLSYSSDDPDKSFRVLSNLLSEFMSVSSEQKRGESRNAFEFIDSQVTSYKRQLEAAEEALKTFRAANRDGTEANVQARIQALRGNIEDLRLAIEETEAQLRLTSQQLERESPFREVTSSRGQSSLDRRLMSFNEQLDSLRLVYHDTHPDVINLRTQIEELMAQRDQEGAGQGSEVVVEMIENPIYQSLSLRVATAETDLQTRRNRLRSMERLLQEEFQRSERIASNEAEETELMRDYNVTRQVYEEMLERRESARLSMTLDSQGQGVTYRIHEPATYPTVWDGLQMVHFGAVGPVIGSGLVVGLMGALVMFDQKIRSDRMLRQQVPFDVKVLAAVPQYRQSFWLTFLRPDVLLLLILLGGFLLAYAAVLLVNVMGFEFDAVLNALVGAAQRLIPGQGV